MSWISDSHREWHHAHGAYAVCPIDCGAMSPEQAEAEAAYEAEAYAEWILTPEGMAAEAETQAWLARQAADNECPF
jgi:hypothetical protein